MKHNTFENNTAQISGGAVYYNAMKPEGLLDNVFIQNLAGYGPNFGSFPTQLKIIESDMDWSKQFVSGRDINRTILIGLFDDNDQQYNIDSNSEC